MAKASFFTGQPIFNQVLSLIPRTFISKLSRQLQCDRYCKKFRSYDHLVTLLYCTFHRCTSLREVVTGMQSSLQRLTHLGLSSTPRRSTLADANCRRPAEFFQQLYHHLYQHYYGSLPDSLKGKRLLERLFIVDSTTISLFSAVMEGTGCLGLNGKKKGGVKAHVLLRAKNDVPGFIRITKGKESDHKFLSSIQLPENSILVFDKGYRSYSYFKKWTEQKIIWVTRLLAKSIYQIVAERELSENQRRQGVISDLEILLGNPDTAYLNPIQKARLIIFRDPISNKKFEFITNDFTYSAATIADIYKKRWQIELLFKRVKQNFQLHYFLGDNENAIRIQLWSALIADLLIKIIKDKVQPKRKWSMSNLAGLIRLQLSTYINLFYFLENPDKALLNYRDPIDQLQLSIFPAKIRGA
jgi:hypothetical protein